MKKILFVLFILLAACGFVAAQEEEGLGLSVGVELGLGDVADKAVFEATPQLAYERSFLDGVFDVAAEIDYTFSFEDETPQELFAEEDVGYNLFLNDTSTLTFNLHNENNFSTAPDFEATGDGSIFEPSVAYGLALDAGEFAFVLGFPIGYHPEATFGVYATAEFVFPFGLGVEATANLGISPEVEYVETNFLLSYAIENLFTTELGVDVDGEFKIYTISPYLEWYFGSLTVWAGVDFGNIGGEASVTVEPYIGVKYSF